MEEKRAFSKQQFIESGFDSSEYHYAETEGFFTGTLLCKRWGKTRNVLAFINLNNGDKIICSAWQNTGYLGLPDIAIGTRLTVGFEKAINGKIYLRSVKTDEE